MNTKLKDKNVKNVLDFCSWLQLEWNEEKKSTYKMNCFKLKKTQHYSHSNLLILVNTDKL